MGILISKVRIKNFRAIKNAEVHLSQITVLVGANNSGKTSFLKALAIALGDRKFVNIEDLFINKNGEQLPQNERIIEIDILITPRSGPQFDTQWTSELGSYIKQDEHDNDFFAYRTQLDFTSVVREAQIKRFVIVDWDSQNADADEVTANLLGLSFYYMDAQRDLHEDTQSRTSVFGRLANKIEYNDAEKKRIEDALSELNKDAVEHSDVLKHLKVVLEELNKTVQTRGKGVEITPFPKKVRDLHKGMKVHFQDGSSDTFSIEYHGMGTRSWASLLAFKAQISWTMKEKLADNEAFFPVLALEEPEAHLHPNAQREVYRQLTEMAGQKIISTHSPYIAGQADLSELRHFSKAEDETVINRLEILFDIKLAQINQLQTKEVNPSKRKENVDAIKKMSESKREFIRNYKSRLNRNFGELLFSRAIIFCEGETEEQIMSFFAQYYFGSPTYDLGINIIGVNGFENYSAYISLAASLEIPWFVFGDGEDDAIDSLVKDLLFLDEKHHSLENIYIIEDKKNIEEYLNSHYETEVKRAIVNYKTEFYTNQRSRLAAKSEVGNWTIEETLKFMKDYKTKLAPFYTKEIIRSGNIEKCIPPLLKTLFQKIATALSVSPLYDKYVGLFELLDLIKASKLSK